jgi:hypothetical protein
MKYGITVKFIFDRHFAWLKYFTYHLLLVPVLAPNYKQHILSPDKVRKICYSLAELYIKCLFENRVLRRIFGPKRDEVTG